MTEDKTSKRTFGHIALALFIIGLLLPFLIAAISSVDLAMGFGVVSEILALIFGILGWQTKTGKVAVIGFIVLILFTGINYILWANIDDNHIDTMKLQMEKERNTKSQPKDALNSDTADAESE